MNAPPYDDLAAALADHRIDLPPHQIDRLDRYARLLWSWNTKLNLTRHLDWASFVAHDVVDTLALSQWVGPSARTLDVGTGGGVPGLILAIVRPDVDVTVCDGVEKKARAVDAIVRDLGLPVTVDHGRAEQLLGEASFDTLLARAVAPLPRLVTWLAPRWGAFDRLLAIKGRRWRSEIDEARRRGLLESLEARVVATYTTPTTGAESVVVRVQPLIVASGGRQPLDGPAPNGT